MHKHVRHDTHLLCVWGHAQSRELIKKKVKILVMNDKGRFKNIWYKIKDKKNVIGYSKSPKKRIKKGKEIYGTKVMRIYVSKKEHIENLDPDDVVPRIIEGIETDIVEIGSVKALKIDN